MAFPGLLALAGSSALNAGAGGGATVPGGMIPSVSSAVGDTESGNSRLATGGDFTIGAPASSVASLLPIIIIGLALVVVARSK